MKLSYISLLLFVPCLNLSAQQISSEKLNRLIDHIEISNQGTGAVSVFKDGKEIYQRSFGQKAIPDLKWNLHTKYRAGSITKVFTAVLIWQLIEDGKLSLDDKLSSFYPQIPNAQKITIKNLLEHSSGVKRDYGNNPDHEDWLIKQLVTDKEIIDEITRQGVAFEPGDSAAYSNSGFYLLKNIAEKKYGKPYGELIRKNIIKPYRLKDLASADMAPGNVFGAYGYNYLLDTWTKKQDYEYRNIIGVGDIATTPTQLNKFFHDLFSGKIVSNKILQQMLPAENEEFGRNLTTVNIYKKVLYGHAGDTRGSHALAVYDTANNIAIAICINGERYPHNNIYVDILKTIYTENTELPYFASKNEINGFTGLYNDDASGLKLRVYIHEQYGLMCEDVREEVSFPLQPSEHNKVRFDNLGIKIEFTKEGMILLQNGTTTILKRTL
jgi:D-alanyl-D-alanine carboxypeptidase